MYDGPQLLQDAHGYGRVLYVAQGPDLLTRDPAYLATAPHAHFRAEHDNFINRLYAFVRTARRITVFGPTAAKAGAGESYQGGGIQFFLNTRDANGLFAGDLPPITHQLTLNRNHRVGA